jgi:hypothetical protein
MFKTQSWVSLSHLCLSIHTAFENYTLRAEITLCVWNRNLYSHSWVSYSHVYVSKLLLCEWNTHSTCKISLCVWKSYSAFRKQSCACWNHNRAYFNHIRACRNHCACKSYTLRVDITFYVWKSHSACIKHILSCRSHTRECHMHSYKCQNYTRVYENHTLRVQIVLCV